MGDYNQYLWVKENVPLIKGPVLEIGSKFYSPNTSMDYRGLLPDMTYVGTDMEPGENVDKVIDFTSDFELISAQVGSNFNTIICCSVMEHVKDIYLFAANVSKVLNKGGVLLISVPFTWEYHGYPDDYWRFTPSAIKFLYPELDFSAHESAISSSIDGEIMKMKNQSDINLFLLKENSYAKYEEKRAGNLRWIKKAMNLISSSEYRKEFVIRKMLGREYRLSLSCINLIGVKK